MQWISEDQLKIAGLWIGIKSLLTCAWGNYI